MSDNTVNSQVSLMKWMLEDLRRVTVSGVEHLSEEQLFQPPVEGEFPVGAYLMHLAECDLSWLEIISGKSQPEELKKRSYYNKWFDSGDESDPPKTVIEVNEYFSTIAESRKLFIDYISALNDSDLEDTVTVKRQSGERQITKKWIIYHIIEHEAHTRGQMFMLIRKAGWNKIKKS